MSAILPEEHAPRASLLPSAERREKLRKIRGIRDGVSLYGVGAGGIGVIFALALIFVYLFYETVPLLKPVTMEVVSEISVPGDESPAPTVHLTLDRFENIGGRFSSSGTITFFSPHSGEILSRETVAVPEGESVTSFGRSESRRSLYVYGFSDGSVLPLKVDYVQSFPDGVRVVTPELSFPLGEAAIRIGDREAGDYSALSVMEGRGGYVVAAGTREGDIAMALYATRRNMLTGDVQVSREDYALPAIARPVRQLLVNESLRDLFAIDDQGVLYHFDIVNRNNPRLVETVTLVPEGVTVTAAEFLVGSRSLIVGGSDGSLNQWFLVRDEATNEARLTRIRSFRSQPGAITFIEPEYTRKGFLAGDASGTVGLHYATSSVTLKMIPVADRPINRIAVSPINQTVLVKSEESEVLRVLAVDNPHPQTSLSGLWGRVWYEGRSQPEFIWQSSSADDAFESKLSLVPLTVGTLKAALFAMLLATPLAIMGAIYTAYFMAGPMRRIVKPSIELMEALPTVILGFLAGIWLAPYVENNLPILVTVLVLLPLGMLVFGYAWTRLPSNLRHIVPPGWEAALLVPVVLILGWVAVSASPWIELAFFGGSMRQWFTDVGIPYDQRNALIVGLAMGFAVIPTIFSIAEDAVFNVPKHLTQGSLALGATAWQTVVGVVLPTASPGIFSAVMIGFGRAVGETMIVLMASGNSPIVNFNLFEGMRTLAANIAVELPETAVGSTHFRVLFLSALVLLVLTFLLNTAAELVRQRLRKRYASL
ncbi:binding-protein-dependent transport systems inner membrane component [Thioalkalivibrio sulfidiphilus HL-EbGr7]|uniref:Binding-protein-dependent transport systems inner membrane component n=1 Tax=Thioalkalivibrio sulfidiphilus (strain HL-EbGR7) TaxID=396588 RepID=B8GMR2_THISH|nr:ABC transporter permease subunit [Thioalkalivibrio sulfidiphilus]ACL73727.1 binding-protein-dependent transport systems inner membrane component [Thioalkalivibrio sulfidiphilus HL-EbGr7]